MKDRILSKIFSIVLLVLPIVLAAQPSQVLQDIDRQVTFPDTDFRAIYTMVTENPGVRTTSKSYIVLRRDSTNRYLVRIQEPAADRGKAYLLLGEVLYAYDPGPPARFESTSNQDRFESSSLRLSDFTQSSLASEYSILSTHTERLGAYITEVYDLEATRPSTTFQRRKIWVDSDQLIRKIEDYSLSGQLLRTTAIVQYQRLGNRFTPTSIVIVDGLEGTMVDGQFRPQRTVITVTQPTLGDLPDLYFTQAYLEQGR